VAIYEEDVDTIGTGVVVTSFYVIASRSTTDAWGASSLFESTSILNVSILSEGVMGNGFQRSETRDKSIGSKWNATSNFTYTDGHIDIVAECVSEFTYIDFRIAIVADPGSVFDSDSVLNRSVTTQATSAACIVSSVATTIEEVLSEGYPTSEVRKDVYSQEVETSASWASSCEASQWSELHSDALSSVTVVDECVRPVVTPWDAGSSFDSDSIIFMSVTTPESANFKAAYYEL